MNGSRRAWASELDEIAGTWATPRVDVLGVGVSAIDMPMTLRLIDQWISQGDRRYICVTGVHGVMESQRDPRLGTCTTVLGSPPRMECHWYGRGGRPAFGIWIVFTVPTSCSPLASWRERAATDRFSMVDGLACLSGSWHVWRTHIQA